MPEILDWDKEDKKLYDLLFPLITEMVRFGAEKGLGFLEKPPEKQVAIDWELINLEAELFARGYTFELVKAINATSKDFLQQEVSKWVTSGQPLGKLVEALEARWSPVRANMIAVTEVTRAYAEGNMLGWEKAGIEMVEWATVEDPQVDEICGANGDAGPIPRGQAFPSGHTQPPAHISCRCWLLPVVEVP